ncbi:hypothetical protein AZE42_05034, partial [Rhizopogon vesiculosus]
SSQPGDKVKYNPIGGASSKVSTTTGTIVDVKGSGTDAVYTIENDKTNKKREYHAGNIKGTPDTK